MSPVTGLPQHSNVWSGDGFILRAKKVVPPRDVPGFWKIVVARMAVIGPKALAVSCVNPAVRRAAVFRGCLTLSTWRWKYTIRPGGAMQPP